MLTYAEIQAVVGAANGDLYLQSDDTAEGDPGDGWVWDGVAWMNLGPIRGPQGEAGPAGAQGEVGPAGLQGLQGIQGDAGPQGLQGEVGPAGADADLSQLMVVVAHGADNTVARPAVAGAVCWIGTVEPLNAIDGDLYSGTV
jgi:hypothetical protein